jgi:hypothetical protein
VVQPKYGNHHRCNVSLIEIPGDLWEAVTGIYAATASLLPGFILAKKIYNRIENMPSNNINQ